MKTKTLPFNYIFPNSITSFKKLSLTLFVGFFVFLVGMVPEKSFATTYYAVSSFNSYSSNQLFCNSSTPANITATFNLSSCGSGSGQGQTYTVTWYYNTTGTTSNTGAGSTPAATFTTQGAVTGSTVTFTLPAANITLPTAGTNYYYYCVLSSPSTIPCTPTGTVTFPYTAGSSVTVQKLAALNYGSIASGDQTICAGTTPTSMTVSGAVGSGSFTYQWYSQTGLVTCPTGSSTTGWTSLGTSNGANTATYTPATGISASTTYAVLVTPTGTPSCGTATWATNCRKVTVNTPPAITTQPSTATQTVCPNGAASLSVAATGTGLTYQWYSNTTASNSAGSLISGATGATYTPVTSTPGTLYYYVVVSGTCTPAVTSNVSGAVVVNTPPAIATQPSTAIQTVCPNGAASLSVAATGTGLTYQWYSNTTASNSAGSLISGATGATYTPVTSTPGTLYYYVVVSGTCTPAVTSNVSGAVVVNTPPAIATQPSTAIQTVCPNGAASLSVAATGTGLTYQWYSNTTASNSGGSLISGATSATYTPVTSTPGTLYYYVVVSGTCTPAVTSNVSGAVVVNTPPAITTQPSTATQTVCPNGAASLSVAATGTGLTYQWYSNTTASNSAGSLISGATGATYTPVTSTPGTLYYYVVVSGTCTPAVTSNVSGAVVVNTPPAIATQPSTAIQTVCPNGAASLSVAATGTGLTYQWYSNTTASNSAGSLIGGATGATYTPVTSTPGTLYYYVVVSGTCTPAVTSNVSGAVVVNTPPAIATQPSTAIQTVCPNGAASLSVAATGTGLTYQWYSNTTASNSAGSLIGGATGATYTPVTSTPGTLYYYVVVSGTCTPAVTSNVSGAVVVNTPPAIATQPSTATQTVCPNGAASLSVAATGTGLTYQWYSNTTASNSGGSLISGATSATYTPVTSTPGTLYYYVVVGGSCNPGVTSDISGSVIVNAPPAITAQPSPATQVLCINSTSTEISIGATGTGLTYQWYSNTTVSNNGGSLIGGATAPTYSPVTTTPGTLYYYVVVSGTCTPAVTSNVSGAVTVNNPPTISTHPVSQTVCSNTSATFTVAASGTGTLNYAWYKGTTLLINGPRVSGATTATLTLSLLNAGSSGDYSVVVSDASGCAAVTSNTATLTVNQEIHVTSQPTVTQTLCEGSNATFKVTAQGTGPFNVQWYNGNTPINGSSKYTISNSTDITTVPATITTTLNINSLVAADASNNYYVIISNPAGVCPNEVSNPAALVVTPSVTTPVFTMGQTSTICQGTGTVTYTATASNTTGITYTLDATSVGAGNTINGSTGAVIYSFSWSGTSVITASAAGCNGPLTATHTVTVTPTVGTPTTPTPSATTICQGSAPTTYTTSATNATSYTWSVTGTGNTISGTGTTATVTWAPGFSGSATVSVTALGCGTSAAASTTVTVTPTVGTPTTPTPSATTICQGSAPTTYTTSATNATSYSWTVSGSGNTISGTGTTATVTWAPGFSGSATVSVTALGCGTSAAASTTVTVTPTVGTPTTPTPSATTICQGSAPTTYTTSATNATSYTWSVTGTGNTISGTGTTATVTWAPGFSGSATVSVTALGCGTSAAASTTVTVTPTVGTPTTPTPSATTICQGSAPTTYTTSATNATSYSWTVSGSGNTISGTGTTATVTWAPGFSGSATVSVTALGCGTSAAASTTVTVTPTVGTPTTPTPSATTICQGSAPTTYTTSATNATSYTWSVTGTGNTISGTGTTATVTWAPGFSGSATVSVTALGCGTSAAASTTVTVTPTVGTPTTPTPSATTICQGSAPTTYTTSATNATSYSWTVSGSGNTISGTGTTATVTWAPGFSGSATVSVTALGCGTSAAASTTVTVTPTVGTPTTPTPSATTICQGSAPTTYTTSATNATSYSWTVSGSGNTISGTGTTATVTWAPGFSGSATVSVTALGCGTSAAASTTVTVTPTVGTPTTPTPSATTICQGSAPTTYTTSATNATSYTWSVTGTGNTISGTGTTATVTWAPGFSGSATVSVTALGCGTSAAASTTVTVTPTVGTPTTPTPSATTICQGSAPTTYTTSATNATSYSWTVSGSGNTISGTGTTATVTWAPGFSGSATVNVRAVGCNGPSAAASTTVNVSPTAVGGALLPASTTVCSGSDGKIDLSGQTGAIIRWESSTNAGASWGTISNTLPSLSYTNLTQTTTYRAVIQSGVCSTVAYSSTSVVAVNPPFTPTVTGVPSGAICLGSTVTLSTTDYSALSTITDGDFGQANPAGWSGNNAGNNNNDPNSNWGEANSVNLTARTYVSGAPSAKKFMIVTGNASPGNNNISTLSTPAFSTVGLTSAKLEWYQGYNFNGSASGTVQISIDGGSTFSNLIQFNSSSPVVPTNPFNTKQTVDLTAYLGQNNLVVRFYYVGTSNSNWAIDDVSVPASYVPLSYTWSGPGLSSTTGQTVIATPTTAGTNTYTIVTSTGNCGATTTTTYSVIVNPVATLSGVTTTAVCSGTNATISLSGLLPNTTNVVTYNIANGTSRTASVTASSTGTGSFSTTVTTANNNQVLSITNITIGNCPQSFTANNKVTLAVNPLPTATITGGNTVCQNAASPTITLTGVVGTAPFTFTYTINGGANQTITTTNGSSVTITPPTTATGTFTYSLVSVQDANCSQPQNSSTAVTVNPLPIVYNVTGGGAYCTGGTGVVVGLSGSQTSVNYQLFKDGVAVGSVVAGTGSAISFGSLTVAGTYTVVGTGSGCPNNMSGSVTISISNPPAITTNPQPQSVCVAGNTTFSVTATGAATYQWQVSTDGGSTFSNISDGSLYTGTATTSLQITNVTKAMNAYRYRVVGTGSSTSTCAPATSVAATLTVPNNDWIGVTSVNWNTGTNWACGRMPFATEDALIPPASSVPFMPTLTSATFITNLTLQAGSVVTLNGQIFTINGNVDQTGQFLSDPNASIVLGGTGNGTLYFAQGTDSITNVIKDLTVNTTGNFTIGNQLYILNELVPKNGTLNANGNLTIRSTSVIATARVAEAGATARVIGDVTVERFIPAKRAFRLLSPSVTTTTSINKNWMEGVVSPSYWSGNVNPKPGYGTHITGNHGVIDSLDYNATSYSSLFYYDNVRQAWDSAKNSFSTLKAGVPWRVLVRGSRSVDLSNNEATPSNTILRAKGTLKIGPVVYDNTGTIGPIMGSNEKDFSLVGNPYASAVDFDKIYAASTNIAPTFWVYDPYMAVRGAYVNYNISTGTNNLNSGVDSNIQSGQAFFVQASGSNPKLTILESHKTNSRTLVFRQRNERPKLSVQLLLSNASGSQNTADGLVTVFDDDFNAKIGDEDSYKFTNLDENMGIARNGATLSIEGRPIIKGSDTIPLKMWQFRQKSYFLRVNEMNFAPDVSAYIKDDFLHVETPINLNGETMLPFNLTSDPASSAPNRFTIIFKASNALPVVVTDIKASLQDKAVKVEWTSHTETNIDRYEIERSEDALNFVKQGVVSAKGNNSTTQLYEWLDQSPVTGTNFYRIKVIEKSGEVKYTAVVKVDIAKSAGSITVYPNPVTGNRFSINLKNMEKGRYIVMLYNHAGQIVFSTTIDHDGRNAAYPITTRVISKGSYQLHISNENIKKTELLIFE